MEWKIGEAMDYFILFRDTNDPSPIDYEKRCRQRDLLIGDPSTFVWAYVGELTALEAEAAQKKLDAEFEERFETEHHSSAVSADAGEIMLMPHEPGALDFLANISPRLNFLSQVLPNNCVKIRPESEEEKQRILAELFPRATQGSPDFSSSYRPDKIEVAPKAHRSFVQLLPLRTLTDIWQRVGCDPGMDPFRLTAAVWFGETLCGSTFRSSGSTCGQEETELIFKSSIDDQIDQVTPRQLDVLVKCVDIVNGIRKAAGCEDWNIENKYEGVAASTPSLRPVDEAQAKPEAVVENAQTAPPKQPSPVSKKANPAMGRKRPKAPPTKGKINRELWKLVCDDINAANYSAEQLAEILRSRKIKCSASAVKASEFWHQVSSRRRAVKEKTNSWEDPGQIPDNRPKGDEDGQN